MGVLNKLWLDHIFKDIRNENYSVDDKLQSVREKLQSKELVNVDKEKLINVIGWLMKYIDG